MKMQEEIDTIKIDTDVKLEKYYNGRKLRHYLQLLEIAETVCRSNKASDNTKKIARGFANHYRRMVICIAMKPFNPDGTDEWSLQEKVYMSEVRRLSGLLDPDFDENLNGE